MTRSKDQAFSVALTSLGCKLNQAEIEDTGQRFAEAGFRIVNSDGFADVYVVNTCTVTHIADRKSRQLVRHLRRMNPAAIIVATGCYVDTSPAEVQNVDHVDMIVANRDKPRIVELVSELVGSSTQSWIEEDLSGNITKQDFKQPSTGRTRSFLKIEDGCNKFCTFCIVPFARGRERSISPEEVVASVAKRVADGHKEIVLTGVHIGTYGRDLDNQSVGNLIDLVNTILRETAVARIRLSSIEPMDFDPAMLAIWSDRRVCRHMHLPLQSGSDSVLKRMHRRYTSGDFARIVERARAAIPGLAVTTDIIGGFPGETEDEFRESYDFAKSMEFAAIHVFKYSPRRGTRAAEMPNQVLYAAKKERSEKLLQLGEASAMNFAHAFVGGSLEVLYETQIEDDDRSIWEGLSDNYLRVQAESQIDLSNQIRQTEIIGASRGRTEAHLIGSI